MGVTNFIDSRQQQIIGICFQIFRFKFQGK